MTTPPALDELAAALDDHAAILTDGLDRYRIPARGPAGSLGVVVRPSDVGGVRATVAWARRHRVRLLPQGANTGLAGASSPPPDGGVVVLSTERLRDDPRIDPVGRTAVVGAGTRLSELNELAAPHGLALAIDLGADPSIGGMVATNTGGARMLRYGDMRRHVLGVQAVLADEEASLVDELTELSKDNTGLALSQLLVGSSGTLGIVTRVALRLDVLPTSAATAWVVPTGAREMVRIVDELERRAGSWLSAVEVVSANALRTTLDLVEGLHDPFVPGDAPPLCALVELSGPDGAEDQLVARLAELDELGLLADAVVGPAEQLWAVRHSISEGLARAGTVVGFDVAVPRAQLLELVLVVREEVGRLLPRTMVADFGHWGDGGVHCSVVVPPAEPLGDAELAALRELVFGLVVERFGGSFSGEHGIGPVNAAWWARTRSAGARTMTRRIVHACDPLGILGHPGMPYAGLDDGATAGA
ncbi:MAG: FAD-binding oxidoreductase [Microthrixaceae bacterium]